MLIPAHVLPWVLTFLAVMFILAMLSIAGYDQWSTPAC